jgi:hypothetical protein
MWKSLCWALSEGITSMLLKQLKKDHVACPNLCGLDADADHAHQIVPSSHPESHPCNGMPTFGRIAAHLALPVAHPSVPVAREWSREARGSFKCTMWTGLLREDSFCQRSPPCTSVLSWQVFVKLSLYPLRVSLVSDVGHPGCGRGWKAFH